LLSCLPTISRPHQTKHLFFMFGVPPLGGKSSIKSAA
jgi:hypothetical protein